MNTLDELRAQAAESPDAARRLADGYLHARWGDANPRAAAQWYRRAIAGGDTEAMYQLAGMIDRGVAMPIGEESPNALLFDAAERGHDGAMVMLGDELLQSDDAVVRQRGISYLERAASAGDVDAAYKLMMAYSWGEGVEQDSARGRGYAEQAAEGGHMAAQVFLAEGWLGGGTTQGRAKALH